MTDMDPTSIQSKVARVLAAPLGCRWACGGDVPISVQKLVVSQNFCNKLQHVIASLTFFVQLFCDVCCLHDIFK